MAHPRSRIVPFKLPAPSLSMIKPDTMNVRISSRCRSLFSEHLTEIHHEFFNSLDDELFSLSSKAENSTLQTVYFEAMRFIRKEREPLENKFIEIILKQFDDFWDRRIDFKKKDRNVKLDEDSFSLVDNDALEEDLAVSTMIDKLNQYLHAELYGLDKRFAALLGQNNLDSETNPLSPYQICRALEQIIKPLLLDLKIKLIIYKIYEKFTSPKLAILYNEINSVLIKAEILPKLKRRVRGPDANYSAEKDAGSANENDLVQGGPVFFQDDCGAGNPIDSAVEFRAFQELQSLLGGWRERNGFPSIHTGLAGRPASVIHPTRDVLDVLSALQVKPIEAGHHPGQSLKLYVSDRLNSLAPGNEQRSLASLEEDVIDMVGMIFDFILDDKNLPDAVKALLGRLQIPVIKVAILEKGLFSRKSHPVRELLNKLAKAGSKLDVLSINQNPLFAEIESIVEAVQTNFDHNIDLFSELLKRFNAFLEKNEQRTWVIENRTRQTTESKEQIELAKSTIGYALIRCVQGKEIPVFLRSFLDEAWKHVMLLAYLRKDKDSTEWEWTLEVVTRLIWTINPVEALDDKRKILKDIPLLVSDIRNGLENISYDPHKTMYFFKCLENCQVQALNAGKEAVEKSRSSGVVASRFDQSLFYRNLVAELNTLAAGMPRINESLFNDLDRGIAPDSFVDEHNDVNPAQSKPEKPLPDQFSEQAGQIEVGQWLSFKDEKDQITKAKLSWKSQVTSRYVFVNAKGAKVAEKSLDELAAEMRTGGIEPIEDQKLPTMDRAVALLLKNLEKVGNESASVV